MIETKAYKCEYCGRKYHTKSRCKKHEIICWMNPVNKLCGSCDYFVNLGSWCRKCILKKKDTDASDTCKKYINTETKGDN